MEWQWWWSGWKRVEFGIRYDFTPLPHQSLEDFKQEFEERLVERAGEVSHTLNRIQDLVTELEELSQVAHVNKYIRVSGRRSIPIYLFICFIYLYHFLFCRVIDSLILFKLCHLFYLYICFLWYMYICNLYRMRTGGQEIKGFWSLIDLFLYPFCHLFPLLCVCLCLSVTCVWCMQEVKKSRASQSIIHLFTYSFINLFYL